MNTGKTKTMLPLLFAALLAGGTLAASNVKPTPWVMQGVVRNAAGQPIPGVSVGADNTYFDGSEMWTVTDAQGRYKLDLKNTMGAWQAVARIKRKYADRQIDMTLEPDDTRPFGGKDGAIRNFTWRVSGKTPGGGLYGASFYAMNGFESEGDLVEYGDLEVTLTPVGALLDGSKGKAITVKYTAPLRDVPLGTYRVTARSLSGAGSVWVRARGGEYAPSAVVTLRYEAGTGEVLSVDVIRPR
ncbi:carboxypeptidase-like regulatory domain-containing protein [Deinococcus yavapaiensis]|uniref:Carboxypeptidase family protein n=1 Tax=Deinococcus yavapaiensis KR-236 TaxID=694435 RepID=A0A318SB11_9DEIO|nr:carboxypeptidase-like regulatory domain-containing protein [Deinococcus yavapaiensis]PYE55410.1 carboxypeptidase family protein [Deinococcus yavapaiensis KR-236]